MTGPEIYPYEQGVISAIMQDEPARLAVEAAGMEPKHFLNPFFRDWFGMIMAEWRLGKKFDLIFFTNQLRDKGKLEEHGGAFHVTATHNLGALAPVHVDQFIDLIYREYEIRQATQTCTEAASNQSEGMIAETVEALEAIPLRRVKPKVWSGSLDQIVDRYESIDDELVPTGLVRLDNLSPLRRGDMPLIVGERKAGKSIFSLSLLANIAKRGLSVAYYSLEDREPKVIDRLVSGVSRVPMRSPLHPWNESQRALIANAILEMKQWKIQIEDSLFDLNKICASIRQYFMQGKCEIAFIDYAQLVRCSEEKERRQEVEKVSRTFRQLSMELAIPIIVICQLNKDGETRESKAFEQDATACWHLKCVDDDPNLRDISIPYQRNGESNAIFQVTFLGNIARIENHEEERTPFAKKKQAA